MGTLIVIEGTDGSGKATQTQLLTKRLTDMEFPIHRLSFPCYESDSSALVKMYLNGSFGDDPNRINAFAASSFYAVDRYASFKTDWEKEYNAGKILISDRYTISNAIHQGVKLSKEKRRTYLDWLYDFEYKKLGIPAPDLIFYLDVPTDLTNKLRQQRESQTHTKPDIHETNTAYLAECRKSALKIAEYSNWCVINCSDGQQMRSEEDINDEIMSHLLKFLDKECIPSWKL